MDKTILFNLESKPYKKLEITFNEEKNIFEVNEFSENIKIISKEVEPKYIDNKYWSLDNIILEENRNGFYFFYGCSDHISKDEIINHEFFGSMLKCNEYGNMLIAKYLKVFDSTVEILLSTIDDDTFIISKDVIETYKYFIENQVKLIEYLKLDFWGFVLDDCSTFYPSELNIYQDKDEDLKKCLTKESYEYRKKEAKEFLDLYKNVIEASKKDDIKNKLNILDNLIKIKSISINDLQYAPKDNKYGEIRLYFSYKLDEEHGAEMILENGGLNDKNFS